MTKTIASFAALALLAVGSTAYALYSVADTGKWPKSWPIELEPLRKQSHTFVGPHFDYQHFAMRFTDREQFENVWPHIMEVKSKGAPIYLMNGPNFFLGKNQAGVIIHCPPEGQWMNPKTYIELLVAGTVVDLNRVPIPPETPIVDERFKDGIAKPTRSDMPLTDLGVHEAAWDDTVDRPIEHKVSGTLKTQQCAPLSYLFPRITGASSVHQASTNSIREPTDDHDSTDGNLWSDPNVFGESMFCGHYCSRPGNVAR